MVFVLKYTYPENELCNHNKLFLYVKTVVLMFVWNKRFQLVYNQGNVDGRKESIHKLDK